MVVTPENFSKLCRLCLSDKPNLNSLYQQNLVQKLSECTSLKVDRRDDLPKYICSLCMCQLNTSFVFKKLCEASDTELRQFLLDQANEESANENSVEDTAFSDESYNGPSQLEVNSKTIAYATDEESNSGGRMKKRRRIRCTFCTKLVYHFQQHMTTLHSDEDEVKQLLMYPLYSKERIDLIEELKKLGNSVYSSTKPRNSAINRRSRKRRPYVKRKRSFGSRAKSFKVEVNENSPVELEDDIEEEQEKKLPSIPESTSQILAKHILPLMRNDAILEEIKSDPLLLMYGSELCDRRDIKERSVQMRVRNSLRQMARLLMGMKVANGNITQLMDVFDVKYIDSLKVFVDEVAELNVETHTYAKEYLAAYFAAGIRKCGRIIVSNAIIRGNDTLKTMVENYLQYFSVEFNKWFPRTRTNVKDNSIEEDPSKIMEDEEEKGFEEHETSSLSSEEGGGIDEDTVGEDVIVVENHVTGDSFVGEEGAVGEDNVVSEDGIVAEDASIDEDSTVLEDSIILEDIIKHKKKRQREEEEIEILPEASIETPKKKGKPPRRVWSTSEINAVRTHFFNLMEAGILPAREEVMKFISEEPCVDGRTWQQVKAWISNQYRKTKFHKKESDDFEVE